MILLDTTIYQKTGPNSEDKQIFYPLTTWSQVIEKPELALKTDLSNYVTITTLQRITGDKTFTGTVKSQGNGFEVYSTALSQVGTKRAIYKNYGIEYYYTPNLAGAQEKRYDLSFPEKSGTLVVNTDLDNYVTLDTQQTITGLKIFDGKTSAQRRAGISQATTRIRR